MVTWVRVVTCVVRVVGSEAALNCVEPGPRALPSALPLPCLAAVDLSTLSREIVINPITLQDQDDFFHFFICGLGVFNECGVAWSVAPPPSCGVPLGKSELFFFKKCSGISKNL